MAQSNSLQDIYLFKQMTDKEMMVISEAVETKSYAPGEDIFNQDDTAMALYVIKFGSVRIRKKSSGGDNIEVATLGTGSHFGEMAFVDGEKRSATATAIEKSDIIKISYDKLRSRLEENPVIAAKFYSSLSHFLCGRLRITTNDLSFSRELNLRYF
jgi:CRP/FNR family cyclic AMP-dependent transcriptional regulator